MPIVSLPRVSFLTWTVLQRQHLLKKSIPINSHVEPLWCRSRLSRSLTTWTGWFLDSLVLQYFLDSLLVLFSLSLLPLLSISWLTLAEVPLSSLHPNDIFCVCSTSYSCLSPDKIFCLQPRFLSSKETRLLCLPRQMVLLTQCVQSRLIKIPAASSWVCRVCDFS